MSTELASLKPCRERMLKYKAFALSFSYPDDSFFTFFPEFISDKENLRLEYDRLFRRSEIWLYGSEYVIDNEFQRAQNLADINGFYRAFGLEPHGDRPDSLSSEFEFMYYLIFKISRALEGEKGNYQENASICLDAGRRFFAQHLYPAALKVAQKIISETENSFYLELSRDLLEFLNSEKKFFKNFK